jgi:hypothetical protein
MGRSTSSKLVSSSCLSPPPSGPEKLIRSTIAGPTETPTPDGARAAGFEPAEETDSAQPLDYHKVPPAPENFEMVREQLRALQEQIDRNQGGVPCGS